MQTRKRIAASAACERVRDGVKVPKSIQRPQMGRNRVRVGLQRKIIAHRTPKMAQRAMFLLGVSVGRSGVVVGSPMARTRRAMTRVQAKRKVVREVSHSQWTAYWLAAG